MSYDKVVKLADKFYGKYFEKKALPNTPQNPWLGLGDKYTDKASETFKSDPYKKDEANKPINIKSLSQAQVKQIQGNIYTQMDGIWGPDSIKRLEQYEKREGLEVSQPNTINTYTFNSLNAGIAPQSNKQEPSIQDVIEYQKKLLNYANAHKTDPVFTQATLNLDKLIPTGEWTSDWVRLYEFILALSNSK